MFLGRAGGSCRARTLVFPSDEGGKATKNASFSLFLNDIKLFLVLCKNPLAP